MSDETKTASDAALAAQGAGKDNLDSGASGSNGAPKPPPAPSNEPPKKDDDGKDEVHGQPVKKDEPKKEEPPVETPEQKVERERQEREAAGPLKDFITLDDPNGQAAIELLKESGLGPNEANSYFAKAIETGDVSKVDWAGMEKRLGKTKTTLVRAGVESYYNGLLEQRTATVQAAYEIFGGEDNWKSVRDWARQTEKGDATFKSRVDEIRSMLDEGGVRAEAGARELLRLYNASPNTKGLGNKKLVQGDSNGNVIGTALTRADYLKELHAAHSRKASPQEIATLDARRRAGKSAGI